MLDEILFLPSVAGEWKAISERRVRALAAISRIGEGGGRHGERRRGAVG